MEKSKKNWEWHTILIPIGISLLISLGTYVYGLGVSDTKIRSLEQEIEELKTEIKEEKIGISKVEQKADKIEGILSQQDLIIKIIFEKIVKQDPNLVLKHYDQSK